jgi:hypothetical protein
MLKAKTEDEDENEEEDDRAGSLFRVCNALKGFVTLGVKP